MVEFGLTLADIVEGMLCIFQVINVMKTAEAISLLGTGQILFAGVCMALSIWSCVQTFKLFDAYMDGDEAAGEEIVKQTLFDAAFTLGLTIFSKIAKPILKLTMKKKLIKMLGTDVVEELLSNGAEIEDLSKLVKNLKNLSVSEELISEFAKKFGDKGLDWLRQARGLSVSADIVTEFSKLEEFADNMDDILEVIKKSSRSADEVAECLIKYGDKAAEAIRKYGDDAVDAIGMYGDEALEVIGKYGDDAVDAISKYGDDALDVIDKYGDDAAKGFKDGKTPDEVEKELGGKTGESGRYSGSLVKVNKPDEAADALAVRIGGDSRVKFSSDSSGREFDVVSDEYIAQAKPDLSTYGKSWRKQTKATFEAAKETGRKAYFQFEGQPDDSILRKIEEYGERYGVEYVIDTTPLGVKN